MTLAVSRAANRVWSSIICNFVAPTTTYNRNRSDRSVDFIRRNLSSLKFIVRHSAPVSWKGAYIVRISFFSDFINEGFVISKICVVKVSCPELLSGVTFRIPSKRTRCKSVFHIPRSRSNAGKRVPLNRMSVLYNKHCLNLDMFSCYHRDFKLSLQKLFS